MLNSHNFLVARIAFLRLTHLFSCLNFFGTKTYASLRILAQKHNTEFFFLAENEQKFEIPFVDYGRHLADNNVIQVFTTVRVKETDNLYVDSYDVQITSPKCLTITVSCFKF